MKALKRKCRCCGRLFRVNPRVSNQRYCSELVCQKRSRSTSRATWLKKPENKDYFHGPVNARRVHEWRLRKTPSLYSNVGKAVARHREQDLIIIEAAVRQTLKHTPIHLSVQDMIIPENLLLLGFISQITNDTEQDMIEKTLLRIYSRGRRMLSRWLSVVARRNDALSFQRP